MDGTRTASARLAALIAATAIGLTLVAAAVLTAGQRGGLHPVTATERTAVTGAVTAPRTTPPPTFPAAGGVDVARPRGTLAATTVEHS